MILNVTLIYVTGRASELIIRRYSYTTVHWLEMEEGSIIIETYRLIEQPLVISMGELGS